MKRWIVATSLLAGLVAPGAANAEKYGWVDADPIMKTVFFLNSGRTITNGDIRAFTFTQVKDGELDRKGKRHRLTMARLEVDCKKNTSRTLYITMHDSKGEWIDEMDGATIWQPVERDTIAQSLKEVVCGERDVEEFDLTTAELINVATKIQQEPLY